MATRWQLTVVAMGMLLTARSTNADIYRWDTGEVIPVTGGIEPGVDPQGNDGGSGLSHPCLI